MSLKPFDYNFISSGMYGTALFLVRSSLIMHLDVFRAPITHPPPFAAGPALFALPAAQQFLPEAYSSQDEGFAQEDYDSEGPLGTIWNVVCSHRLVLM